MGLVAEILTAFGRPAHCGRHGTGWKSRRNWVRSNQRMSALKRMGGCNGVPGSENPCFHGMAV